MTQQQDGDYNECVFHIEALKAEAEELSGGALAAWESPECPPDVAEQFWEQVVAYERADTVTYRNLLDRDGVTLPAVETLDDDALRDTLWRIIDTLARRQIYLHSTNHLSDRALYTFLCDEVLAESTRDLPPMPGVFCGIDLVGSGSDEDIRLWLTYYADDEDRARWATDFPDDPMPAHLDPPYERDRHLPHPVLPLMETDEQG